MVTVAVTVVAGVVAVTFAGEAVWGRGVAVLADVPGPETGPVCSFDKAVEKFGTLELAANYVLPPGSSNRRHASSGCLDPLPDATGSG